MNAYAALYVGSLLTIPAALLYRVLNPLPPKEKPPERRKIGAIYHCDIRLMQEAWKDAPAGEIIAHYDREAALDAAQTAEDAVIAAAQAAEASRRLEAEKVWEASLAGRITGSAMKVFVWGALAVIALVVLSPLLFLFGWLIAGLGSTIITIFLIAWCLNDFKNDIADEVIARQEKSRSSIK